MSKRTITGQTASDLAKLLDSMQGPVTEKFRQSVQQKWDGLQAERDAERELHEQLAEPNRKLRRFIQRYLRFDSGQAVAVGLRQYVTDWRKDEGGRQRYSVYIHFDVHLGYGMMLHVEHALRVPEEAWQGQQHTRLMEILDRVQRIIDVSK